MSQSTPASSTMDMDLWTHVSDITISAANHFGLEDHEAYTLGALRERDHPIGHHAYACTQYYSQCAGTTPPHIPDADKIPYHIGQILASMPPMRCTYCHTSMVVSTMYLIEQGKSPRMKPCIMHPTQGVAFTYGINIPSGRMAIANDLRGLVYAPPMSSDTEEEPKARAFMEAYARVGLFYLDSMRTLYMYATHTADQYLLSNLPPHAEADAHTPISAIPAHLTRGTLLAHISTELWGVCIMDGDHADQALARLTPAEAARVREDITYVQVAPGYYSTSVPITTVLSQQGHVALIRVDDSDACVIQAPHTFTMAEAMRMMMQDTRGRIFSPFHVWNTRIDWAIGCPTHNPTGGMGEDEGHAPAVPCPVPDMRALYHVCPTHFTIPRNHSLNAQDPRTLFPAIPGNIAPEAIACWIAGADATVEYLRHATVDGHKQPITQHLIVTMARAGQDFRDRLWGAAVEAGTTDTVDAHIQSLRDIIDRGT